MTETRHVPASIYYGDNDDRILVSTRKLNQTMIDGKHLIKVQVNKHAYDDASQG